MLCSAKSIPIFGGAISSGAHAFERAQPQVDQKIGSIPLLCGLLGAFCVGFAALLEVLVPWERDLPPSSRNLAGCDWFSGCKAWPPSLAGALLGLMQAPALLVLHTFLGSATAYQVACSVCTAPLVGARLPQRTTDGHGGRFEYLAIFATPRPASWWQLWCVRVGASAAAPDPWVPVL